MAKRKPKADKTKPADPPQDKPQEQSSALPFTFPLPHTEPLPAEAVMVPVHIEPDKIEPMPEVVGPVRCIATRFDPFWGASYIVLAAEDGHALPNVPDTGMRVDVQFSPPSD